MLHAYGGGRLKRPENQGPLCHRTNVGAVHRRRSTRLRRAIARGVTCSDFRVSLLIAHNHLLSAHLQCSSQATTMSRGAQAQSEHGAHPCGLRFPQGAAQQKLTSMIDTGHVPMRHVPG